MATKRRMFSDQITNSDAFLDMPPSSQNLYFHMNMESDDDGFLGNPKMVMRKIGSNDDDLKLLSVKKFIIMFEGGICVIKHWRIHNQLRKDRYWATKYVKNRQKLFIRENGAYTLNPKKAFKLPDGFFSIDDILVASRLPKRNHSVVKIREDKRIGSGVSNETGDKMGIDQRKEEITRKIKLIK